MRRITLRLTDYDSVSGEDWFLDYPAYLISPTVIIYSDDLGIYFRYYDEPINDDTQVILMRKDSAREEALLGDIPEINIDDLPNLTIAKLAILLKGGAK
ncbi:hypothetical protein ACA30_15820 [Virgibacillus soli]|nr:hypothetical protein ACA30_15820 [Virgibacillus soli]